MGLDLQEAKSHKKWLAQVELGLYFAIVVRHAEPYALYYLRKLQIIGYYTNLLSNKERDQNTI